MLRTYAYANLFARHGCMRQLMGYYSRTFRSLTCSITFYHNRYVYCWLSLSRLFYLNLYFACCNCLKFTVLQSLHFGNEVLWGFFFCDSSALHNTSYAQSFYPKKTIVRLPKCSWRLQAYFHAHWNNCASICYSRYFLCFLHYANFSSFNAYL